MTRARRFLLLGLAGAVGVIALALVGLSLFVDSARLKAIVAEEVRVVTGRDLTIGGDFAIEPGFRPRLVIEDAHLSNADWSARGDMLSIERLEISVSLSSLFGDALQIERLAMSGVHLKLERDVDGRGNWEFAAAQGSPDASPSTESTGANIGEVLLEDLQLHWFGPEKGDGHKLRLKRLALMSKGPNDLMQIDALAEAFGHEYTLNGELTELATLMGGGVLRADVAISSEVERFQVKGSYQQGREPLVDLEISGEGGNLAQSLSVIDFAGPDLPWQAAFKLSSEEAGWRASDIVATLGESDLSGDLLVIPGGDRPHLSGSLSSQGLDITPFYPSAETAPAGPANVSGGKVFDSSPWSLDALGLLDLELDLSIASLQKGVLKVADLKGRISLDDRRLVLEPLKANLFGARTDVGLTLDNRGATAVLALKLDATGLDMDRLLQEVLNSDFLSGRGSLSLDLKGRGASTAALMANLDGRARLVIGEGAARVGAVDDLVGGLSKVLGTLVAKDRSSAALNCVVTDFTLRDGVASSRALIADTEHATVSGSGKVNLATEQLNLVFKPEPKSVTLNVAVPVEVTGSLGNPSFTPEKLATGRKLLGALSAVGVVANPVVALVALAELGTGDANPCVKAIKGKTTPAPKRKVSPSAKPKAQPQTPPEDVLEAFSGG